MKFKVYFRNKKAPEEPCTKKYETEIMGKLKKTQERLAKHSEIPLAQVAITDKSYFAKLCMLQLPYKDKVGAFSILV